MIYKFKSKAAGDVIMLAPQGDQLLRLLGREPAAKGIIEVSAMAAAIETLLKAVADEEALRSGAAGAGSAAEPAQGGAKTGPDSASDPISLRRRVWPLIEMLRRSAAEAEPIVWGV